jgi:tetratricopeptide (TPR) repeat protein
VTFIQVMMVITRHHWRLSFPRCTVLDAMLRLGSVLLILAACTHAPAAPSPAGEVLATPGALAEARASWVSSTARLARAKVMQGHFEAARSLLEPALDRATAENDAPGKARLQAELALAIAEESFYTRSGAKRGVELAQAAQTSARTLRLADVEAQAVHAEGFLRYGELLWTEAKDFRAPRELFTRSRGLFQAAGDASGVSQETFFLGLTEEQEGKLERAEPLYAEALRRSEAAGDRATQAYASRHLGGVAESRGDLDRALALHRRCLALREEIGLTRGVPFALIAIGDLERKKGALADARASYTRALAIADELDSAPARVWSRFGLGAVDEAEGRLAPALENYQGAQRTAEQLGSKSWVETSSGAAEKVRQRLSARSSGPVSEGTPRPSGR